MAIAALVIGKVMTIILKETPILTMKIVIAVNEKI